jgi:hypothetical protein
MSLDGQTRHTVDTSKLLAVASSLHGCPCVISFTKPAPNRYEIVDGISSRSIVFDDGVEWIGHIFNDEYEATRTVNAIRFVNEALTNAPVPRLHTWSFTTSEIGAPFALTDSWQGCPIRDMWRAATLSQRTTVLEQLAGTSFQLTIRTTITSDLLPAHRQFHTAHDWMQDMLDRRLIRALKADLVGYVDSLDCLVQLAKLSDYIVAELDSHPFPLCNLLMSGSSVLVDSEYRVIW